MTRLVAAEVLAMFLVLRSGGDFVCKTFELATPAMLEIVWLLHQSFAELTVVKPVVCYARFDTEATAAQVFRS